MKIIKKIKRKITNKVRRSGKYFSIQIALVSMLLNMFSPFLLSYSYVVYAEDIVAPATEEIASEEPSIDESKSEEPSSEEESTDTEEVSSQETSSTQETTAEGDQNSDPVVKETVTQETEVQENALNENIETIDTEPETINEPEPVVEEISVEYPVVAEEPIEEVGTEETVVTEENAIEPSTSEPSVEISTEPASSEPEGDILPDGISDYRPEPEITPAVTDTDEVADPVAEAVEQKTGIIEQVCLSEGTEIINSTNDDWNIDSENGYAETKDPVKLGVKYIFPEEKDVTLTFKCLPVNEEDKSILKIQKVKVEDLNLPDEFKTDAEYAYDITTEMEDGSFEYDLTLPKPEGVEAEVSYVEKNIEEVISEKISSEDIISVEEENIDQEQNDKKVKISELDHFTIYIVRTSGHLPRLSSGTVNNQAQVTVLPNASITVTLEVTTNGANDVDDWRSSQYKIGNGSWECVDTTDHTGDGTYTDSFEINAPSDVGVYDLSLNVYNGSGCTGGSDNPTSGVVPYVMSNAITVKAPVSNPPLSQACGLDIALVIDNSTSISSTEMTQIKNAMTAFVNALNGTPTWFSVTKFATTASVSQTFTGNLTSVKSAINAIPVGGGFTNWQDGLTKAQSTFDPRSTKPNLIIFASDGNPNRTGPTGTSVDESVAVANAVVVADSIKTGGTRILALGVGADLDTANMIAISGTEVDTGDVLTSDVITSDFNQLAADLAEFASQTCGGTITINKYIDIISDSNLADDAWSFTTNVSGYESVQTSEGSVNIPVPIGSGYSVTESSVIPGFTFGSASCQKNDGSSVGTPGGFGVTGIAMGADDIISCNFLNTTNKGSITIEKDAVPNDPQDFSFTATGLTPSTFSLDDDSDVTLSNTRTFNNLTPGGTYAVSETGVTGWELTGASCSDGSPVSAISLQPGENITCTFTNTRQKGTLTVIKDVNNDEDGTASASDFQLYVKKGGVDVVGSPFSGSETGTVFQLDPGAYVISEDSDSNYISSISGNCASDGSVTISAGDNKTCTITNDDKDFLPSIEVTKTAGVSSINEPGGNVTYTFTVKNLSTIESVTITSLEDDKFGSLAGDADCQIGTVLAAEATCSFDSTHSISGDAGDTHTNKFTAIAEDNEHNKVSDDESEDVTFVGAYLEFVDPIATNNINETHTFIITVMENAGSNWEIAPGELVTFTLVNNTAGATFVGGVDNCTTNASGQCTVQINSTSPGSVEVHASVDVGVLTFTLHRETDGTLGSSENATKTYLAGRIIIEKQTLPEGGRESFEFDPSWSEKYFSLIDSGSENSGWLAPGTYSIVETPEEGWEQTSAVCSDESPINAISLQAGETITCTFTNTQIEPELFISKSNDSTSTESIGNLVEYTIKVRVEKNKVKDVNVIDLLPKGFDYQGDGKAYYHDTSAGTDTQISPVISGYASPGYWQIGDIDDGDYVKLVYTAKILSEVDAGIYKDLAMAYGNNEDVRATGEDSEYVNDEFVGTTVEIDKEQEPDKGKVDIEVNEEEVLGSSDVRLPATGISPVIAWAILAGSIIGSLLLIIGGAVKLMKKRKEILSIIVAVLIGLFSIGQVQAAGNLVVRLEDPDPAVIDDFNITFVVLDLVGERSINYKCYFDTPGDPGNFDVFQDGVIGTDDGDTANCNVDEDVLDDEGTYHFYVKVWAGTDEDTSDKVKTSYDGTGPDKPKYIEKDKKTSCKNEITLKTSDDGDETVRVEVYRSDEMEFTVKDSNRIKSKDLGSDEKYTFVDEFSGDDCGKKFYYGVRAFDASGNASKVRSEEITETTTVEKEGETTVETEAYIVSGTSVGTEEEGTEGAEVVLESREDEDKSEVDEGSVLGTSETEETKGFLQGLQNTLKTKWWLWGLGLLFLIIIANVVRRKKANKQ